MREIPRYILRFLVLVLVQVLILNNINFLGYINPYIYIFFILILPARFSRHLVLIIAFVLGLTIDTFANTYGIHTFSTVLIAYLRPVSIKLFTNIEEDTNPIPSLASFGVFGYIKYMFSLVLIHHASFYLLEVFSFVNIGFTLLRILLNSLITAIILLGIISFKRD